jgi:hypothetical protein
VVDFALGGIADQYAVALGIDANVAVNGNVAAALVDMGFIAVAFSRTGAQLRAVDVEEF